MEPQLRIHFQANYVPDQKKFRVVLESVEQEQHEEVIQRQSSELWLTGAEYEGFVSCLQERKDMNFSNGQNIQFLEASDGMRLAFSDGATKIKFSCDSSGYSKMLEYFELILEQYKQSSFGNS